MTIRALSRLTACKMPLAKSLADQERLFRIISVRSQPVSQASS